MLESSVKTCFAIGLLALGLYVYSVGSPRHSKEGFAVPESCPNLLVEKDGKLHLYNTAKAGVPGVNPIVFNDLDEYTEFIQWLRSQRIKCPVLKLTRAFDAQNNEVFHGPPVYKAPGVPILPSGKGRRLESNKALEPKGPAAFDPAGQDIGGNDAIDKMYRDTSSISADAMQMNWGGAEFASEEVAAGEYSGDEIYKMKGH